MPIQAGWTPEQAYERAQRDCAVLKNSFLRTRSTGQGLTSRQVFQVSQPVSSPAFRLLANMMADHLIERFGDGWRPLYRVTSPGWLTLDQLDGMTAEQIYDLWGRDRGLLRTPVQPIGSGCQTCRQEIVDRRRDATLCWGCEDPFRRMKHGGDHHARTRAYYERIGPTRARAERKRLRALVRNVPDVRAGPAAEPPAPHVWTIKLPPMPPAPVPVLSFDDVPLVFSQGDGGGGSKGNGRAPRLGSFTPFANRYAGLTGQLAQDVEQAMVEMGTFIRGQVRRLEQLIEDEPHAGRDVLSQIEQLLLKGRKS